MGPVRYVAPLLLMLASVTALLVGGLWTWFIPVFSFVLLPILDQVDPGSTANLDADGERATLDDWRYDALLAAIVIGHPLTVVLFLYGVSHGWWTGMSLAGALASTGIGCGSFGINVAHELGHRRGRMHQLGAKVLLLSTLYLHFFIEHNRGHHRRVATPDDPASARRGEVVYAFWLRSVIGGIRSAWSLEASRLENAGRAVISWENQMVRFLVVQVGAVIAAAAAFGPWAALAWVAASVQGILLLETVNYLEHYGLQRQRAASGAWERVQPHHSWNSNRPIGRIFLFELTRHSDHHAHADRPFPVLRHHDGAPELPAGYPAMVMLALVPPVFHRAMDEALAAR